MGNKEEVQQLLQEFELLEQEGEEYHIEEYLTLEEIKFFIYIRKNKIDCNELIKKIKQQVSN